MHKKAAQILLDIFSKDPHLKDLFQLSIDQAQKVNPDPDSNPVRTLEDYYNYLDWTDQSLPWKGQLPFTKDSKLPEMIDQAMAYFFFLIDQPLKELEGRGQFNPSLEYVPALRPWIAEVCTSWGRNLSSGDSWSEETLKKASEEPAFKMSYGWYEDSSNWHSFNDFFSRKLSSPTVRPIDAPDDDTILVSPADSEFQGWYNINENSVLQPSSENFEIMYPDDNCIHPPDSTVNNRCMHRQTSFIDNLPDDSKTEGAFIKSKIFRSVPQILGDTPYRFSFAGGAMTHAFLSLTDYHRYHSPVDGVVRAIYMIPGVDAAGGLMTWDAAHRRYNLELGAPEWQSIETRGCMILKTKRFGLVALLPIAMCEVSSVNFLSSIHVGSHIHKGDEIGYFLFGGSDFMMLFQKQAHFKYDVLPGCEHLLVGQKFGEFDICSP